MSVDQTRQLPVQRPAPQGAVAEGMASNDPADELRALARRAVGLVVGLTLLIGCGFAVSHLAEWGQRWTMPLMFVVFVLVMLLASNLVVGGASALWSAARASTR